MSTDLSYTGLSFNFDLNQFILKPKSMCAGRRVVPFPTKNHNYKLIDWSPFVLLTRAVVPVNVLVLTKSDIRSSTNLTTLVNGLE